MIWVQSLIGVKLWEKINVYGLFHTVAAKVYNLRNSLGKPNGDGVVFPKKESNRRDSTYELQENESGENGKIIFFTQ